MPDAAAQALKTLMVDKKAAYSTTLRRTRSDGKHAWTLFEMWPATVSPAEFSLTASQPSFVWKLLLLLLLIPHCSYNASMFGNS